MEKLDLKEVFLVELHELSHQYSKIGQALKNPEKLNLDDKYIEALKKPNFTDESIQAIEKLVESAMFDAFFDMVGLLDGIGDPRVVKTENVWVGLHLKEPTDDDAQYLNEQFYESYDTWEKLKNK
ncbi:hypothetical protein [Priestia megaterium]|uniref:hypothetical protein n=1 Tax=Priestia megaterium TaxID=1404 RepID=UPI001BE6B94F|nr:hypothetical protein [Priestia megaterium]MBT2259583.1 hypothetical protein [Priestia megaterium]MBT2281219.1 hypothetical protein [Priestia megaterium]